MRRWLSVLWQSLASLFRASADQPYRILFDGLADPTFVMNANTHHFLHANPAAEKLLGYTRDELLTMTPLDLHPTEEQEALRQRLDDERDRGAHQYRARTRDGSLIPVEVHSNPITLEGRPAYVSVMRDLSEREAERHRMADLARLVAESPTPMLRLACNGAVLYANEAARSLLAYAQDGTPRAPRAWNSWVTDALRADQTTQTEADVEDRICLLTFVPYVDRQYVNVYSLDITDRVRATQQLKQERDLAEGLVNTAPAIVLVLTPDGRVVRTNTYTERLLGQSAQELVGCDWMADFVPEPDRQAARNALQRAANGEIVAGHRNRIESHDGDTRLIEWYTATLHDTDAGGSASHVLAIGHDVSEREQLETRLRMAQKMEAVGQLAGGIAHDFNNLLQVINGNVEFLLMEPGLGERHRHDVAEIKQAGTRAAELTAQLLAYSRQQAVRLTSVDLRDLLRQMWSMLTRTLGERIRITLDLAPDTPYAKADPSQMEQATLNLALNARDAMPDGGELTLGTRGVALGEDEAALLGIKPGRYAVISVRDTGVGMDQAIIEHVFEPFFTTKEVGEGTGLGLAQVYGIVTGLHGAVSVESAPRRGSTFRLYLPAADGLPPSMPHSQETVTHGNGETILIAEDDPAVRRLAARLLARLGYGTLEAANVADAVAMAQNAQERIHLVLTDLLMPDGSGVEAARRIRAMLPDTAVIYMTGYAEEATRATGAPSDGAILYKPFSLPQIANAVSKALSASSRATGSKALP